MKKRGRVVIFGSDEEAVAFGKVCAVSEFEEVRESYTFLAGLSRLHWTLVIGPEVIARLKLSIDTYYAREKS